MSIAVPARCAVWLCLAAAGSAHAGRPLSTDDAATADLGSCLVEAWAERGGGSRAEVVAAACGVAPGLELGAERRWARPRADLPAEAGVGLKWAPESARVALPFGAVNFGLKLNLALEQPPGDPWRHAGTAAQLLASWRGDGDALQVHANLGVARDAQAGAGTLKLAAVWAAQARLMLFAEVEANNHADRFGRALRTAGLRVWLVPDRLGLDLTASREAGAGAVSTWTMGFGWYGSASDAERRP